MERRLCVIILWLFALLSVSAQEKVVGHIVDAETGEALPYVSVYVSGGQGTISNTEGDFHVMADEGSVLTFSCVGYEKQRLNASAAMGTIRLQPFTSMLNEVRVEAVDVDKVLRKVIANLKKDYKRHRAAQRTFLFHTLLTNAVDSYIIEAFLNAEACVNIRSAAVTSGHTGLNNKGIESKLRLNSTNIHRVTEIGPMTYDSEFWQNTIKPLSSAGGWKRYYTTESATLHGVEGDKIYSITFNLLPKKEDKVDDKRYLTGTIQVDAHTCRLLSFNGRVNNGVQRVDGKYKPSETFVHINYDYKQGYCAVSDLVVEGGNDEMHYKTLLYGLESEVDKDKHSVSAGGNLIMDIASSAYDSTLWVKHDIIKKTTEEEL
ncbi:MAG: carboxypeptidase-like regulatory domain-containing protein, partial [Bacteroidaceae bacterium]|nr:carboxypeptidase-like regulatory domain-containing protein [Bacteroidaceae bacterium]